MISERNAGRGHLALVDIGTAKTAVAIVAPDRSAVDGETQLKIAGLGLQKARGIKAGVLTDIDEAEIALRDAISQAERAANLSVNRIMLSVSCGRLKSLHFTANGEAESGIVTDQDLHRLTFGGRSFAERDGRSLIHLNRMGVRLDGAAGHGDPRGYAARSIAMDLHAVTADEAPLRNLLTLIDRCYLKCEGLVATPYASGVAVTTPDERDFGVTTIDFGAGTTSIALFSEGRLVGVDVIPIGSQHITFDIAKALQTPLGEAERIKTLYGTLVQAQSDEYETFSYPLVGENEHDTYQSTKLRLSEIIRPRVAQIIGLVAERLQASAAMPLVGDKVVITGGASQLIGMAEFAGQLLGRHVRVSRPSPVPGLTSGAAGPQLSVLLGLAEVALPDVGGGLRVSQAGHGGRGYLGRVGSWLKAGF